MPVQDKGSRQQLSAPIFASDPYGISGDQTSRSQRGKSSRAFAGPAHFLTALTCTVRRRSSLGRLFMSQHASDCLVTDAELGAKAAQALGSGEDADRSLLVGRQLARAGPVASRSRDVRPRQPARGSGGRPAEVQNRKPPVPTREVLKVRIGPHRTRDLRLDKLYGFPFRLGPC